MQKRFYLFVFMLLLSTTGWATSLLESPGISANLPSEETAEEIMTISEPQISLRQAPDEDGFAQKEIPLGDIDTSVFFILLADAF